MTHEEVRNLQTAIAFNIIIHVRMNESSVCDEIESVKADNRLSIYNVKEIHDALRYIAYGDVAKCLIEGTGEVDITPYDLIKSINEKLAVYDYHNRKVEVFGRTWRVLCEDEQYDHSTPWKYEENPADNDWLIATTEEGELWMNNNTGYMVLIRANDQLFCQI